MQILNGHGEDITSKSPYFRDDAVVEVIHVLWDKNKTDPRIRTREEVAEEIELALERAVERGQQVSSLGYLYHRGDVTKFILSSINNHKYFPPNPVTYLPGDVVEVYRPEEIREKYGVTYNEGYCAFLKRHNYEFNLHYELAAGFEVSLTTGSGKRLTIDNYQIKRLLERRRDKSHEHGLY